MVDRTEFSPSVLAGSRRQNAAATFVSNQLGSVANTENGNAGLCKGSQVDIGRAFVPNRTWASRKDESFNIGCNRWNLVKWVDFAINIEFSNPTGDQLCVLGTKIQDQNLLWHRVQR